MIFGLKLPALPRDRSAGSFQPVLWHLCYEPDDSLLLGKDQTIVDLPNLLAEGIMVFDGRTRDRIIPNITKNHPKDTFVTFRIFFPVILSASRS